MSAMGFVAEMKDGGKWAGPDVTVIRGAYGRDRA